LGLLIFVSGNLLGVTFTVTNTNDSGPGSLRDAINSANLSPGNDLIDFNILGVGVQTIFSLSQLPPLTDTAGVFIDGLTQPGSNPGINPPSTCTLMIEINGVNAGVAHGLWVLSPNNIIQGLVINNFQRDGIRIQATPAGYGTSNNIVYYNFIGTDPLGNIAQGNGWNQVMYWAGVYIICTPDTLGFAYDNFVCWNLISANYAEGVGIASCPPGDVAFNWVGDNYIGTDVTGTIDMGNIHDGVYIGEGAHDNTVDTNLISGNDFEGVCIVGYAEALPEGIMTWGNMVWSNIIGLDINLNPLPNTLDGVSIGQYGNIYQGGYAPGNLIERNTIANNGDNGVTMWEHSNNNWNADGNLISQNSIYDNSGLGIDLQNDGLTFNDPADPDSGPNQELNYPVIDSALYNVVQTTVYGTIDIDTDPTQAIVEVFKVKLDPSNYGEGEIFLGSTNPVNAAGDWSVVVSGINIGDSVTATTTDMNNNTSEFCNNVTVAQAGLGEEPVKYELTQNTPNPFSNSTTIQYAIPKTTHVRLSVFDVSGRLIKVLADGVHNPSYYNVNWNGKDSSGRKVSQGVYFYRLEAKGYITSKKLIFLR